MPSVVEAATRYLRAGLSVVPTIPNEKRPTARWRKYQTQQMDESELVCGVRNVGKLGIITGFDNIECLDFDCAGKYWPAFRRFMTDTSVDVLLDLYVERSPSGGVHVIYRCEQIDGNKKLAMETPEKVAIETRGVGGFVVVAPSPGYEALSGDLCALPTISPLLRSAMMEFCRSQSKVAKVEQVPEDVEVEVDPGSTESDNAVVADTRIGTWYNKNGDHAAVLKAAGWEYLRSDGPNEHWARPWGKDDTAERKARGKLTGGTWHVVDRLFYVFTSSTGLTVTQPKGSSNESSRAKAYSLFHLLASLQFDDDFSKAAKHIIKLHPDGWREVQCNELLALVTAQSSDEQEAAAIVAQVEKDAGRKMMNIHPKQARIYLSIRTQMRKRHLTFDALGAVRCAGQLIDMDMPKLCRAMVVGMRNDDATSAEQVSDILLMMRDADSVSRRQTIVGALTGKSSTKEGERELERFMDAVCEKHTDVDTAAVKHLIWNTKAKQTGRHGQRHHVVVLFNPAQDAGKSEAAKRFISPWQEIGAPKFDMLMMTDERCTRILSLLAIGNIDEMAGMKKADLEKVKSNVTADTMIYRPMTTNDVVMTPMRMSFIATSNTPVCELVKDVSGNRRFYQLTTRERLKWDIINDINYETLWSCVSENDTCPILAYREAIASVQQADAWKDSVEVWLAWEDEAGDIWSPGTMDVMDPSVGQDLGVMYERYSLRCRVTNVLPVSISIWSRRMEQMGWSRFKPHGQRRKLRRVL